MKDFRKNIIQLSENVLVAVQKLNEVPETLTLFVIDKNKKLLGTITDGDIRRGLISGLNLQSQVSDFMYKSFNNLNVGFTVSDIEIARSKGIRLLPVLDSKQRIIKVFDLKTRLSILPLECMIMAGGRGERLRPLTDTVPKPMLKLGGKPILEHNIDHLIKFGIEKIYISINYLGEQIIEYFGDGSSKGITIEYIREEQASGTVGALSLVKSINTDLMLLYNGDIFSNANIKDLYLNVINNKASMGVATIPYTTKVPYGIFVIKKNKIIALREKPIYTDYANAGIYIIDKRLIKKIPKHTPFNTTDLMEQLISDGLLIIHNPIVGYWIDIGQHQDFKNAQELIKHKHSE